MDKLYFVRNSRIPGANGTCGVKGCTKPTERTRVTASGIRVGYCPFHETIAGLLFQEKPEEAAAA